MKMLLFVLFLGFIACDAKTLKSAKPPLPFFRSKIDIDDALKELQTHILSTDGKIPHLNDYRRHYTEIFHVILNEASDLSGCVVLPYIVYYQQTLNRTAAEAYKHPQSTVDEVKDFIKQYNNRTSRIQSVINDKCDANPLQCDRLINEESKNPGFPNTEIETILLAGKFAKAFLDNEHNILTASKELRGLQYVVIGARALEHIVVKLSDLLRDLHSKQPDHVC